MAAHQSSSSIVASVRRPPRIQSCQFDAIVGASGLVQLDCRLHQGLALSSAAGCVRQMLEDRQQSLDVEDVLLLDGIVVKELVHLVLEQYWLLRRLGKTVLADALLKLPNVLYLGPARHGMRRCLTGTVELKPQVLGVLEQVHEAVLFEQDLV